ncbi:unnamed protein product, partial [Leptidea sinapis]
SVAITIDTTVASQDQTTGRANTLLDDADDIQKQLDNEVRDRLKYRPITGWVLSTPIHYPTIMIFGHWDVRYRPSVFGGAANRRRYHFHSLILHTPSEHRIGGLQYPIETQLLHVAAEYTNITDAIAASTRDPQAILGLANLFKIDNTTLSGIKEMLKVVTGLRLLHISLPVQSLNAFNPPFREYVSYQGSLTYPPCTEAVLWVVRARALTITRKALNSIQGLRDEKFRGSFLRETQPLNDRNIFYFH